MSLSREAITNGKAGDQEWHAPGVVPPPLGSDADQGYIPTPNGVRRLFASFALGAAVGLASAIGIPFLMQPPQSETPTLELGDYIHEQGKRGGVVELYGRSQDPDKVHEELVHKQIVIRSNPDPRKPLEILDVRTNPEYFSTLSVFSHPVATRENRLGKLITAGTYGVAVVAGFGYQQNDGLNPNSWPPSSEVTVRLGRDQRTEMVVSPWYELLETPNDEPISTLFPQSSKKGISLPDFSALLAQSKPPRYFVPMEAAR